MSATGSNEVVILNGAKDPAFCPAAAVSPLVRELWTSLVSLLRSHAAMYSIARPGSPLRIAADANSATLLGPRSRLTLLGPDASQVCSSEFRPEAGKLGDEYSKFSFTEEGLIQFEGPHSAMDMETAVEHWLRKVQP